MHTLFSWREVKNKCPLGRPWPICDYNINICLNATGLEDADCIDPDQGRDQGWAVVSAVMIFQFK